LRGKAQYHAVSPSIEDDSDEDEEVVDRVTRSRVAKKTTGETYPQRSRRAARVSCSDSDVE
jgi:hypothetical protein